MAVNGRTGFVQRPKAKTPAERSVEFDAVQAKLRADAAARRKSAPERPKRRG
jgi:hypothetical protein